jgi:hypothetical protein
VRRGVRIALLPVVLAAGAALDGCPPPDNPCVRARAKLCAADSPMRDGGICARLRADGDHPDDALAHKCAVLLDEAH